MYRDPLLRLLTAHRPLDRTEADHLKRMIAFVQTYPDCFERTLAVGHITGAAWIVSPDRSRVLLTHHQKLDCWLQLGGHADGDPDVLAVALREGREESGLQGLRLLSPAIFDVDIHPIPATPREPGHDHYDIRFIFEADPGEALQISPESKDLAWIPLDELGRYNPDPSMQRMAEKTRRGPD